MTTLDELTHALKSGQMSRRRFLQAASALGLAAPVAGSLFSATAQAQPKSGGTLRLALDGASTSDSLDPATYATTYMLLVGFATHNTLTELRARRRTGRVVGIHTRCQGVDVQTAQGRGIPQRQDHDLRGRGRLAQLPPQ